MLQVGMLFADIYDPMKALSIILALSLLSGCTFSSLAQQPNLSGRKYTLHPCTTYWQMPGMGLTFLNDHQVCYSITYPGQLEMLGDGQYHSRITTDTLSYRIEGDSIILERCEASSCLAGRPVKLQIPQPLYSVWFNAETNEKIPEDRTDTLQIYAGVDRQVILAATDITFHVWLDKTEISRTAIKEGWNEIRIPGRYFEYLFDKIYPVYELRYKIDGKQYFALLHDEMTTADKTHSVQADFDPPFEPCPFHVLYPDVDLNQLHTGRSAEFRCGWFEYLPVKQH